jgi:hypothetical protein
MVGKPKTYISRYLGGLDQGLVGCSCWLNMVQ